jgi:amino acid adenylation domain-containing protein/thioester reductase-like protein
VAATSRRETTPDAFVVVVNDQDQRALWRAGLDVPSGWRRASAVMARGECLAVIDRAWPDIAPASVRADARGGDAGVAGGGASPTGGGGANGDRLVHEVVAEQAVRRPDAVAVIAGRTQVSYRELDSSANRLARYLGEFGAGPEAVIGVYLERGVDVIRAILAIMKVGAGYLPLDPSLPPERLNTICSQMRPAAVIAARADAFPGAGTRLLPLGELADELAGRPETAPTAGLQPDNLCYAIYTSGSTGDPKPVAVSHRNLACVIAELAGEYAMTDDDRVAQMASMAFDTSIEQVFVALTSGATLLLPPPGTMAPSELLRRIERRHATVLDLTPAYWHQLLALTGPADERLRSVRLMITGGEPADPEVCRTALQAAPWARLLNAYGLTETTITSALFDVGAGLPPPDQPVVAVVPVGRPVGRARITVVDEELNPVPAGTAGEICIGGPPVARGYLGRPALTAERFVPDPGGARGSRMYRTGDLGRWLADGNLEVLGRMDRQLKVRGFRVEPGEIETVLAGHPDIDQVAVVASTRSSGDTRLVAYYTPSADATAKAGTGTRHPSAASFRGYLLDRLPGYMIPAAFVARHRLPTSPERDELAALQAAAHQAAAQPDAAQQAAAQPDATQQGPASQEAARQTETAPTEAAPTEAAQSVARPRVPKQRDRLTPTQSGLAALWARLLHREHVGLDDDFFALGGNSLLAAEMLAGTRASFRIPSDSVRPLTRCLLRDPTLRGFAAAVRDARSGRLGADGDQPEIDFVAEAALDVIIRRDGVPSRPRPDWRNPREILLTGATGFLGAHLLRELLAATDARVLCLVRAGGEGEVTHRIEQAAARYELPAPPEGRVIPLPGDLGQPGLGLSGAQFRDLARTLDIIYHPGALVNFIYPYQELRAANVAGTRELIRLAGESRGIPVHYVSTTAVLAGLGVEGTREVTEETPLDYPEQLRMGYVETKYVAEELLRNAGRAGLPVAIYRPLDIVGSIRTGAWSTSTEMCALIRFMTDTGLAPDIDLPLDYVPADVCAAAIRHISVTAGATGRTYHLASPEHALLGDLVGQLRDRGYGIDDVAFGDWVSELARQAALDPSHPMAAFMPLFVDRDGPTGLTVAEMYLAHVFPSYSRTNTERALRGSGIAFPPVSGGLIDRNIDRLMQSGYLPSPSSGRLPSHAD